LIHFKKWTSRDLNFRAEKKFQASRTLSLSGIKSQGNTIVSSGDTGKIPFFRFQISPLAHNQKGI